MLTLFRIYFLSIKRHPLFEAKLIKKILSLIGICYLFANLVVIGFFLDKTLVTLRPGSSPMDTFSRFFIYLFVMEIILKYFSKASNHVNILPYVTLPIKQKKIFSLLFVKELLSAWNFIWVVILTPFLFKTFYPVHHLSGTCLLLSSFFLISAAISFLIRYTNIVMVQRSFVYGFIPALLVIGLGYAAYYISIQSGLLINIDLVFSKYELYVLAGILLLLLVLYVTFLRSSKHEIYAQLTGKNKQAIPLPFKWIDSFGVNGEIMKLCLKEMMRSQLKRTVLISLLFLFYYLFIYNLNNTHFIGKICFAILPLIMVGASLGELSFSTESTFFDRLITSPQNTPYLILINKYVICLLFAAFCMILSIILYYNKISILFWVSVFFFECGILLFFIFQNAVYNKQRFDILGSLRKISDSNIYSFLSMGFTLLSFGIVLLIDWLVSERAACYFMLITGLIFTLTSPLWLKNIYNRFLARKYQNINGFRNT
ncbi:DUF5687 family protein [Microbacter margulisiae]|uniref:ABC-2 type transport system permease protein n=1 Tax=Microbacter margulisiae TaxID=1350067 RepID=A0A7W5H2R5_9PORP|nr:DUF5687 family protein [Microbacter margulisiae]MBB3187652.1 hypothetical protein [Microbacter margulisiae]